MKGVGRSMKLVAIGLFALAVVTILPSAPAYGHAPTEAQKAFEIEFMQETIDHHFSGVEMAELCLDKATSKKLRRVCSDIATGQAEEIRLLQRYLEDWYEIEKEPELMPADQQMLEELAALEGRAFDVALSEAFIEHHRTQIGRSQVCLEEAFHRELVRLCKKQITTQSREIRVFEQVIAGDRNDGHGEEHGHDHHGHDHGGHAHEHPGHHGDDDGDRGERRQRHRDDD